MDLPKIATTRSIKVELEKGKTYMWCKCGLSENQPFCDGSHSGTSFLPEQFTADETKIYGMCGCKRSLKGPLCDGAHKEL